MTFAVSTTSAIRNGKRGILSGQFLAGNFEHAYNVSYVRWFSTELQAHRYILRYVHHSENPVVLDREEILNNPEKYFD